MVRSALESTQNFADAAKYLEETRLITPAYIIAAGKTTGEGVIINRERDGPVKEATHGIWTMADSTYKWFELETNYDHWHKAPAFDDRRDPANKRMEAIGTDDVDLDRMFEALSKPPVFA